MKSGRAFRIVFQLFELCLEWLQGFTSHRSVMAQEVVICVCGAVTVNSVTEVAVYIFARK